MIEAPFLTAEWRHLAMLNFEIAPDVLRPYIPAGTELDEFESRTLISVVGFRFLHTRVLGLAVPFHRNFEEVNLRFYVRRRAAEGWRRGVVFVRELVPRNAIALVARVVYNEPYRAVPMRHRGDMAGAETGSPGSVRYEWRSAGRWQGLEVQTTGLPVLPPAASEAEFITEHYWGYTAQRDGGCKEYQVLHPRWPVWSASHGALDCDVAAIYGNRFVEALSGVPRSSFVAVGSEVTVHRGRSIGPLGETYIEEHPSRGVSC